MIRAMGGSLHENKLEHLAVWAQIETAAQLAELNETLRKLVDPAVGCSVTLCASNDNIPVRLVQL